MSVYERNEPKFTPKPAITPVGRDVAADVRRIAARLKRDYADEIARDAARFKKHVLGLIRQELPPRPGRPNNPRIDQALAMVSQGKSIKQVLRHQVPGFDNMDTYSRYLAEKGLRTAIARRRRRRPHPRGVADQEKGKHKTIRPKSLPVLAPPTETALCG